jgi:hypothetical protein
MQKIAKKKAAKKMVKKKVAKKKAVKWRELYEKSAGDLYSLSKDEISALIRKFQEVLENKNTDVKQRIHQSEWDELCSMADSLIDDMEDGFSVVIQESISLELKCFLCFTEEGIHVDWGDSWEREVLDNISKELASRCSKSREVKEKVKLASQRLAALKEHVRFIAKKYGLDESDIFYEIDPYSYLSQYL